MAVAFQSLIGIRKNWNLDLSTVYILKFQFQSLIGIRKNWNKDLLEATAFWSKFQSLIGIRKNWNFFCFRAFAPQTGCFNP